MNGWLGSRSEGCAHGTPRLPRRRSERPTARLLRVASGGLLALLLPACDGHREIAVKDARVGDLLVKAGDTQVVLKAPFQPGVANGLYKGVVGVSQQGGQEQLHRVNAVCSIKGEPGWPAYDNLFGDPVSDLAKMDIGASPNRWQIFYHFDGRVESNGKLAAQPWMARLKDNLCRRGEFDDSARSR